MQTTISRNPAGRTPGLTCLHGHDMTVTRRRRKSGETYCVECKRSRNRKAMRYAKQVARMERLLRDGLSTTYGSFREWQAQVWRFFEDVESAK
jgi:hypothetical protein